MSILDVLDDFNPIVPYSFNVAAPHGRKWDYKNWNPTAVFILLVPNDDASTQERGETFRNAYTKLIVQIVTNYNCAKNHIPIIAVGGGSGNGFDIIPAQLITLIQCQP